MQSIFTLPPAAPLLPAPARAPDRASRDARLPFGGPRLHREA